MALITVTAGITASLIECKVPSILEPLSARFGMDATAGSLMMSVFTFMGIFLSIPASKIIQRFGAKRVVVDSVFLMVAGSLLGSFSPNALVLLISRAIEGAALVSTTIAGAVFIRDSAPPDRMGTAVGIWSVWFALGSCTAGVASPVIYAHLGFQPLWLLYAAFAAVAAASIRFLVQAPNRPQLPTRTARNGAARNGAASAHATSAHATSAQAPAPPITHGSEAAEPSLVPSASSTPRYRELFVRDVLLFLGVFAVYNILTLAVVTYLPTILQNQGVDPSLSGFISTLPMLISIASSPLLGILSDRLGRVKVLMSATLLVMALGTPLMFLLSGWSLWAGAILLGLLGCSGSSLLMVAFLLLLPRVQLVPLALGLFSTMQGLGQFLGSFIMPFVLGPQLADYGLGAAALLAIGLVGFAASLLCRYR
ncbi:MAG: MFS transporter [Coriobacteriales bacterium]|jgi:MFS family permease|nr:MFS transporter [Coriobacteriales bacterium]